MSFSVFFFFVLGGAGSAFSKEDAVLAEKFPVCEKNVPVEWVSRERAIGLTAYSLVNGSGEKRDVEAMVYLDRNYPKIDYGGIDRNENPLTKWEEVSEEISILRKEQDGIDISSDQKDSIRFWGFLPFERNDGALTFKKDGRTLLIYRNIWEFDESLANHSKVVCLAYPGGLKALLLEMPRTVNVYGEKELLGHYRDVVESLSESSEKIWESDFRKSSVMDLNDDGVDDYPSLGIYSTKEGYRSAAYFLRKADVAEGCIDLVEDSFFITTDGGDYFLNGTCSLKELTRRGN
ncbi:hypothetical protein [Pseudomonas sp. TUM22785]|uniref:hypothetical protein n=1 Tax=Pseudomonas sp. TUM22785 TaxID=3019098 RepID=UPI002306532B|nr:hypothetical protein [Pseudomonas sp. TUM22785]WCD83182.1 hypothetical protein PI990_14500 [Pseudomonas sp. TUM22785]